MRFAVRTDAVPRHVTRLALVAAALGGGALAPACTCKSPSAELDGGDLMGVFARDAGGDGGLDAGPNRRSKRARDAGAAASSAPPPATARPAAQGVCVTPAGRADTDIRRTQGRPPCRGAQVLEWKDAEGSPRYACVVSPPGVETRAPLPLVVFFHDADDDPSAVHKKTALAKDGASFDLTGDPAHRGFIVLAPQGRHLRGGGHGSVFDTEYTGEGNVDVATVDHFVAELSAKGLVDARRIYALGASSGGQMAATFAMMRADEVAAFAAYGADAPPAVWSCGGPPPPGMLLYRACDGVVSCEAVERWLRARDAVHAETPWLRLGAANDEEPSCMQRNKCTPRRAEGNHHRWPKGREGDILGFFARHALVPGAATAPPPTSDAPAEPPERDGGEPDPRNPAEDGER